MWSSLILNNYVEGVNSDRIMKGAMEGLAEGLDPDSAYLTPAQVTTMMRPDSQPKGGVGLELTRQYYLRVDFGPRRIGGCARGTASR